MKDVVIDASIVAAWLLPDEEHPLASSILDRESNPLGIVPLLWHYEIGNVLLSAERRGRLTPKQLEDAIKLIQSVPIEIDHTSDMYEIVALSRLFSLTYYDASYLELAIRRGILLATLDKRLMLAAEQTGSLYKLTAA